MPKPKSKKKKSSSKKTKSQDADAPVPTFESLGLSEESLNAVKKLGFDKPSPIQEFFIPIAITGKDCIGQARTGTGKTAAFVLPILEQIDHESNDVQAIVLAPTRELSEQVAMEARRLSSHHPCRTAIIVGGRPAPKQIAELKRGAQLVVGTPGRVIDLINRGVLKLSNVRIAVLDEADRMLDIGFRPDIEKILRKCPTKRQTLLLSATLPPPVERLAQTFMQEPEMVDLSGEQISSADTIEQFYATVDNDRKFDFLVRVLRQECPSQVLVFTRTKRGADKLYHKFNKRLSKVAVMHGDLHQTKRDRVMKKFRAGDVRLLIATDVVGRGIDVSGISHIVNYDIPEYHDDYVHRVGRTGRLSSDDKGCAITFVTKDQGDQLTKIEIRINQILPEYIVKDFAAFKPRKRRNITMYDGTRR